MEPDAPKVDEVALSELRLLREMIAGSNRADLVLQFDDAIAALGLTDAVGTAADDVRQSYS
jgi:hypothetical protein